MGDNKYLVRVTGIFVILGAILAIPLLNHLLFTPLFGPLIALAAAALIYLLLTENRTSVTGEVYALRLGKANAALLIFTFGWPFLLFGLYKLVSPGRDIPFGFIATTIVKPYVYLFYVIAVLSVTKKRLRSLNLDSSWLVVLAFPMFSSVVFWLAASAPWSVSFALGAVGGIPDVLLAIYTVLIALCLAAPAESNIETRQREVLNSPLWHFCSVLLLTIVIYHVANDIVRTTSNYELWSVFSRIGSYLAPLSAAFRLAAIALCYQLWVAAGRPGEHHPLRFVAVSVAALIVASAAGWMLLGIGSMVYFWLTQSPLPGVEAVRKGLAYLRAFEFWGLMLMPLIISRILASSPTEQRSVVSP